MHAMLGRKTPIFNLYFLLARKTPTHTLIRFEDQRLKSTLGEMESGGEACNSTANDYDIIVCLWLHGC